jgi:threonine dehydratase
MGPMSPPEFSDIVTAAGRIAGVVRRTPLITHAALDAATGGRVFCKAECLQTNGAFKMRGAYNAIATLPDAARARGVLAFSSGNHAIAVAASAKLFGVAATIVMPSDAPHAKRAQTEAFGARVVAYDRVREDREAIGRAIAAEHGYPVIPPFDHADVIAGQGTAGLEAMQDMAALGATPDVALVCASGGGLAAGFALAVHETAPTCAIYPVEPVGHEDLAQSLAAGERRANAPGIRSICDALMADKIGALPFAIGQKHWAGALAVSDAEVLAAMAFAALQLKLVVEPGGAAALAAALAGKLDLRGKTALIILSGGNVDPSMLIRALTAHPG